MPMSFADLQLAVSVSRESARHDGARIRAQSHGATHNFEVALVLHEIDDRVRRLGFDFARVRMIQTADVSRELDAGELHAVADAEERHAILARETNREELAFDATRSE